LINEFADDVNAILMAYLPGPEGGRAIADVLFGDFNPCGKLPITYPGYANDLRCYDHKFSEITPPNEHIPQYPFGLGVDQSHRQLNN
jgi:beta-glucosidase